MLSDACVGEPLAGLVLVLYQPRWTQWYWLLGTLRRIALLVHPVHLVPEIGPSTLDFPDKSGTSER